MPNRDSRTATLKPVERITDDGPNGKRLPDYDLIVIGGGINGSGIARDAAERGLTVLLLDKDDFGAGTSAYSSRLIHGGLRYLANFEFDLVRESLRERELLLKNAPHLVRPLPMAIPVYRHSKTPRWMIGLGMLLYDLFSRGKRMPGHRMYGRKAFMRHYPAVNGQRLSGGPVYYDAQVALPERICVENAVAALESGHATVLNHARVTGFLRSDSELQGVAFTDRMTGEAYSAHGKVIINASGPWVDELLGLSGQSGERLIGGTKGSHIIVHKFPEAPETALYVEAQSDGRPFFIIPWRNDYMLIGTTDIPFEGDLDSVSAERDEVNYLLSETSRVLPSANLSLKDVLYSYAGVRPLPYTPDANDKKAGKITRKHWIVDHGKQDPAVPGAQPLQGLISIIGGKLTTYRNLGEEAVDYAVKYYQLTLAGGRNVPSSNTRQRPLPGGVDINNLALYKSHQLAEASRYYGVPEATCSHLIDLYGSRFSQVLKLTKENPAWKEPLSPYCKDIAAQVIYAVRQELACSVQDVLLRRVGCGLDGDVGLHSLNAVADWMAAELDWTPERLDAEKEGYLHYVNERNLAFLGHPVKV
ncbi:MAG: glpD [Vampirovibrio sp.]|nr:glpD [Vampirovibrio sp.]